MFDLLTRERKTLLAVTAIVFIVSTTLIWQTYQTMQIYNTADAACTTVRTGMNKNELQQHAQSNQVNISIIEIDGQSNQAKMGFSANNKDSCGCMISLQDNKVTEKTETFCQTQ